MSDHEEYATTATFDLRNPDGAWLLLLLHGLGGDRQQALGLIDGYSDPRIAVLAPDLRAHGESPIVGPPGAFTFEALSADLLALIDRLGQGSKPVIVAGISMGAALALRLAISRALDLRGMALVRPAFDDTSSPDNLAVLPVTASLLRSVNPEAARASLLASPEYRAIAAVTESGASSALDQLEKPMARERAVRLAEVPKNVAWRDDGEMRGVDMPALVIGVDRDVMHPLALARRTAELLPEGRFVEATPRDVDPKRYDREIRAAVLGQIAEILG